MTQRILYKMIKRILDLTLSILLITLLIIPMAMVAISIIFSSGRPVLYFSDRIGIDSTVFKMPKFRSMKKETPPLATHLMKNPDEYLFPVGSFIRKYSLDELPQLFSILKGDMSFVGPRPALFNQNDLINLREKNQVDTLKPGLTGLAQINGRDSLTIQEKVIFEIEYMHNQTLLLDFKILWLTFIKVFFSKDVSH
jgi:O-antigen biosynthesis protein WbqP